MLNMIEPFNYADVVVAAAVLFCMLISMRRGMVVEVVSIATLVAAVYVATEYGELVADQYIGERVANVEVRYYLAVGLLFVFTMFAGSALNYIMATIMKSGPLRGADRMLGAIFGFVRGVLIVCVAITLLGFTQTVEESWWGDSVLIQQLQPLAQYLTDRLPELLRKLNHLTFMR